MNDYLPYIRFRHALAHSYRQLTEERQLRVVYFGGSITNGYGSSDMETRSWRALSGQWLRERFPQADIHLFRSAIGESGTFFASFRVQRDLLPLRPDLLFIEYAVNDHCSGSGRAQAALQFETIVREVRAVLPECDIVTVLTGHFSETCLNELYGAAQGHEDISVHYGLPSVHVGRALADIMHVRSYDDWLKYFIDKVHPNDAGYGVYAACVITFLEHALKDAACIEPESHAMPCLFSSHLLDGNRQMTLVSPDMLQNSHGFSWSDETILPLPAVPYKGILYTTSPDAELTIPFTGTECAVYTNFSHFRFRAGLSVSVDNAPFTVVPCCPHNPSVLCRGLPGGSHTLRIRPLFTQETPERFFIGAVLSRDETQETRNPAMPVNL